MIDPWICPHCRRMYRGSPHPHLARSARTPQLAVGQRVTALVDTDVCRVGEAGTVTEEHSHGRYWAILFDGGRMDYWNPCQAGLWFGPGPVARLT